MKLTREQFEDIGPFYMDDFPIDDGDQDLMFKVFNYLPEELQGLAVSWGCNDSVFRDNVFEYLCKKQLGMSCEQYYKSNIAQDYFKNSKVITIDFTKFK